MTPHIFRTVTIADLEIAPRPFLMAWLSWNDSNGTYTDEDCLREFGEIPTTEELRAAAIEQVQGA